MSTLLANEARHGSVGVKQLHCTAHYSHRSAGKRLDMLTHVSSNTVKKGLHKNNTGWGTRSAGGDGETVLGNSNSNSN
jgi:hypothetical protein